MPSNSDNFYVFDYALYSMNEWIERMNGQRGVVANNIHLYMLNIEIYDYCVMCTDSQQW